MQDSDPRSRLLLVEGQDDKHVVLQLRDRHGIPIDFCIKEKTNNDQLLKSIRGEARAPGRTALGIVLDANDNPDARWQAVTDRLRTLGEEGFLNTSDLPANPVPNGTVISGRLRIGLWLMPDNRSAGELENFVEKMIPAADPVWPLSQQYIDGIPEEHRAFKPKKIVRAQVHAWLATRAEPRRMGLAIKAGDLDASVPNSATFLDWLRRLFN